MIPQNAIPDPFFFKQSKHRTRTMHKKKKSRPYSKTPTMPSKAHPKKKRRLSTSPSSASSSDLIVLNGHNKNNHNHRNGHNHKNNHRKTPKKKNKRKLNSSYNIYANDNIPDRNLNGFNVANSSSHSSGNSWANPISPIPFHQERDRRKISKVSTPKSSRKRNQKSW